MYASRTKRRLTGLLLDSRRIEPRGGLGDALVEQVRVALERDQRVRVAGNRLDELDVGAGGDEARNARVTQIVEAVALGGQASVAERRLPRAPIEVRRVERRAASRREHELVRRVASSLNGSGRESPKRRVDRGKERDRADAGLGLRTPQLSDGVGALDSHQATVAVDVREAERAERAKLAEAQTGTEGDVEEMDVKGIRFVSERIARRELEKRGADRVRVRRRDLLACEVLWGRKSAPAAGFATMRPCRTASASTVDPPGLCRVLRGTFKSAPWLGA